MLNYTESRITVLITLNHSVREYTQGAACRKIALSEKYAAVGEYYPRNGTQVVQFYGIEDNGSLTPIDKIYNEIKNEFFGWSLSVGQDYLVVGATENGSNRKGAVHLYKIEDNGSLSKAQTIRAPDASPMDEFGFSVTQSGDLLAVGAYNGDSPDLNDTGAVYLYRIEDNGSTSFLRKFTAPDGKKGDQFGDTVALSGTTLAVGAPQADVNGVSDAGAVYLFDIGEIANRPPTNLNSTTPLTVAENQPVGTVVGEFNATDPDANAILTFSLVSGAGC